MRREFRFGKTKYVVVNRFTNGYEIDPYYNPKYDIYRYDCYLHGWIKCGSSMTIRGAYELIREN